MPLFRALGEHGSGAKARPGQKRTSTVKFKRRSRKTDEDGSVLSLERLCMLSLADNMKEVWVKDYSEKYLDEYCFRQIMGPFNLLCEFVRATIPVADINHEAIYYTVTDTVCDCGCLS